MNDVKWEAAGAPAPRQNNGEGEGGSDGASSAADDHGDERVGGAALGALGKSDCLAAGAERLDGSALNGNGVVEHERDNTGPEWSASRPATTVAGDARIFPGPRDERNPDYEPGDEPVSQGNPEGNAVRVTAQEASILQSFEPDYPWQGSRTKQFQQIGNAVPPLLAQAILASLTRQTDD